MSKIDPEL